MVYSHCLCANTTSIQAQSRYAQDSSLSSSSLLSTALSANTQRLRPQRWKTLFRTRNYFLVSTCPATLIHTECELFLTYSLCWSSQVINSFWVALSKQHLIRVLILEKGVQIMEVTGKEVGFNKPAGDKWGSDRVLLSSST